MAEQGTQSATQAPPPASTGDADADLMMSFVRPDAAPKERDPQGRFAKTDAPQQDGDEPPPQESPQQADGNEPEERQTEQIEIDPEAPLFEVQQGEETKKLSLKELKSGWMMQQDYTRKTQELADERRRTAQEKVQAVETERSQYLQTLGQLQALMVQSVAPELQNVDWNKLAVESPADYVRLDNRRKQAQYALQRVAEETQRVTQQQEREASERRSQAASESVKVLKEHIPAWNDDLYSELLKRGVQTYGYTSKEVGEITDHRFIELLHDAHQFRALKDQKPVVDKKVAEVPKVVKPGQRQPVQNGQQKQFQDARTKLRESGRVEDAADVFRAFTTPRR